jgi:hypothetical protein
MSYENVKLNAAVNEVLRKQQSRPSDRYAEAVEFNCIEHLKRLQKTINDYNKIHGTKISMSDVKLYKPEYPVQLNQEGAAVAYASSDRRVIDAAEQSTREHYFEGLIKSSPKIETPNLPSTEVARQYSHFTEALRGAEGDSIAAAALTRDGMRDAKAYQPNYNKDWSGKTKVVNGDGTEYKSNRGLPDETKPNHPAYSSVMTLKFSDKTAFDSWFASNSNVEMLSNPSVNMDDGSISVEVSSAYVNQSGTNMTSGTRAGGPWTSPTRTR